MSGVSRATNRGASGPTNRLSTPYAPERAAARQARLWSDPDREGAAAALPGSEAVRTPSAPDDQPPRRVQAPVVGRVSAAKPRRRRTSTARRLIARLTERDGAILRDLARFGALTVEQIGRRHFGSVLTAYGRLKTLADAGYVELVRVWHDAPGAYVATPEGARVADGGLPPARVSAATLGHHLRVADVAERLLAAHVGARWVTERELRRDAMAAARERGTGRLLDGTPHVPDGLLVLADGRRVAVEVECSGKVAARYRAALDWYAASMDFDRVRWFVAEGRVRARLAELVRSGRLDDLVSVEPLPAPITSSRSPAF